MRAVIRGNTTARAKKKPYKIKLQKKADLLLRGDDEKYGDKDWLLILDESLSAKTGFKLNELAGMQWTPSYQYVNLILNGEYKGLYMLCESVERNKSCRLNVDKSGYIFEYDASSSNTMPIGGTRMSTWRVRASRSLCTIPSNTLMPRRLARNSWITSRR